MTAEKTEFNKQALTQAANEARGLAMDAVAACNSGHLGLPLGAADIGAILFGQSLQYNPKDPKWLNRDRFVLSAGHGSMFLYAWLHIAGYDLSIDDIKNFRVMHSKTPGHPEFNETPGVEATTGPLGQGVGNAVGMACAAKMAEGHFNTPDHRIFNHHIVCLCGDGDLQEGVAMESMSFAGRHGLDNLIFIYDSNDVTLDAMADKTQNEDVATKYEALGFDVETIDGHSMEAFIKTFQLYKASNNGKPKMIIAKTLIGKGITQVEGTSNAHGESGVKFIDEARFKIGLPAEKFYVSDDTKAYFKAHEEQLVEEYNNWQTLFEAWKQANPEKAILLNKRISAKELFKNIPEYSLDKAIATRSAGGIILNDIANVVPLVISGSADLHGSTKNYIKDTSGDFDVDNATGRNIYFGIREHAMGAIVNGFGYHGVFRASGATFLTFSDYMRPSLRLAALAQLPVFHIFTHDSVGVGQDGPTHQPVEHVSSLRLIPNLDVMRPADPEETAAAYAHAVTRKDGPVVLILSRQNLPNISSISVNERREGTLKGAYIAKKEEGDLRGIILATGSELVLALEAADQLEGIRVVSMPCMEAFERQSESYQEEVLPKGCSVKLAVEAGVSAGWYKYANKVVGIDKFGLSAPGDEVMEAYGVSVTNIVNEMKSIL